MGNVYRDRDEAITGMMDDMHRRLKNGTGRPLPRGTNHAKPSLDYQPPAPSKINKPSVWPKRLTLKQPA